LTQVCSAILILNSFHYVFQPFDVNSFDIQVEFPEDYPLKVYL